MFGRKEAARVFDCRSSSVGEALDNSGPSADISGIKVCGVVAFDDEFGSSDFAFSRHKEKRI